MNSGGLGGVVGLSGFIFVYVCFCVEEVFENGRFVVVDDGVVGSFDVIVVVRDIFVGVWGFVCFLVFDFDFFEGGKVVVIFFDFI